MLILDVLELLQVGHIFVLDLLETHLHLIHLFIQGLVIFLDAHQLLLATLLLDPVFLLPFLLGFQLLLQLLNAFELALVLVLWGVMGEVFLQGVQFFL